MKNLFTFILLAVVIAGCTVTKGVYDSKLTSKEPYDFMFSGTSTELETHLKRLLVSNAFTIESIDSEAGILTTAFKELTDDEKYNMNSTIILGVSVSSQKGKLLFMYAPENDSISVQLSAFVAMETTNYNASKYGTDASYGGERMPQGHPLMMKYRNMLLKDPRFTLK